jgi:hypothetical protein
MISERRYGLQNNNKKFKELLGDDIVFFNKVEKKPEHREESLEHMDECDCDVCKIKALRLRGDKNNGGTSG